jgi:oligo-1,6-glucosidase
MGYDIADYKDIDHRYGSLEDVDRLIAELKKRDMRLVMDLVSTAVWQVQLKLTNT